MNGLPEEKLTPAQEDALAKRIQKSNKMDSESVNVLVLHNMREAFAYAYSVSKGNLEDGEVLSLCYSALRKAAFNFKPAQIRFFGYAKPYVRGEVCLRFEDLKVVKHSEHLPLTPEDMHGDEAPDCETIQRDPEQSFPMPAVVDDHLPALYKKEDWERMRPIFSKLTEQERMVLELKYEGGYNFREMGELLDVSRSATEATHSRALRKIRCELMRTNALFCGR